MIIENHCDAAKRTYDLCVIGSGALGLALALRLSEAGKTVLLLEAGGEEVTEQSQNYYRCDVHGRDHDGSSDGRFRVFGGSTERWGGQAMRFDRADFASRPGIHEQGWPVAFEELAPYYAEAENFMGVDQAPYEEFSATFASALAKATRKRGVPVNNFEDFKIHYSAFTHTPRLREVNRRKILGSQTLFLWQHAAATVLTTDGAGGITRLAVRSGGGTYDIAARQFILAAGGIENARFLLIQRDRVGVPELAGLDTIGRFFQDHPGAHVAELCGRGAAAIQQAFRLKKTPAMNLKGRISWSEKKRLESGLLAVSGTFLMMRQVSDFEIGSNSNRPRTGTFREWMQAAKSLTQGNLYSPLHHTYLAVSAEDVRNPESRIVLSNGQTDHAGCPRARIEWQVGTQVAASILAFVDVIDGSLKQSGLGTLRKFPFMTDANQLLAVLRDNSHHIGSTGMGCSSRDAVVDSELRVLGFSNLWVAGTSVLPTGSHANPTLTALALGYRLADRLLRLDQ